MKWFALFLTLSLNLVFSSGVVAQDAVTGANMEVTLDIWGNEVRPDRIALPAIRIKAAAGSTELNQPAATLSQVLEADLRNSGYFQMIDLAKYAGLRDPHAGPINFEEWASIEADFLAVSSVELNNGQMRIELRLYEIASRKHILAKAYRGKPTLARKMAHVMADDIMYRLRNIRFATSRVIYTRDVPSRNEPGQVNKELLIMDYDGHNPQPITKGGISFSPSALRKDDNVMLAYSVFEKPGSINANYSIYFKPTLLSRPRPLFSEEGRRATSPALSPNGEKLAFSMAIDGNVDLYTMNLDGSDFLKLTRHPGVDTNPSWSPGGNALLFTSDRTGSPQVFRMDADGLNKRRLTIENPYNDSAVWNPVYNYIAYVSRFENNFDIFIKDMREGRAFRVTRAQGSNEQPAWSPDGNQLCFTSNRNGSWQLYVVNINGQNLRQVTFTGNNRNPVWVSSH